MLVHLCQIHGKWHCDSDRTATVTQNFGDVRLRLFTTPMTTTDDE